jgi:hypothetical protein
MSFDGAEKTKVIQPVGAVNDLPSWMDFVTCPPLLHFTLVLLHWKF